MCQVLFCIDDNYESNSPMFQYLSVVRSIKVVFSASAEKLIRGYYVATRRLRGDCVQGSAVPITAIHTL